MNCKLNETDKLILNSLLRRIPRLQQISKAVLNKRGADVNGLTEAGVTVVPSSSAMNCRGKRFMGLFSKCMRTRVTHALGVLVG